MGNAVGIIDTAAVPFAVCIDDVNDVDVTLGVNVGDEKE